MKVSWDALAKPYDRGVSQGILYPDSSPGVAWNGLTSVTEKGDDSPDEVYVDGQKVKSRIRPASFSGSISAYMYPDEFEPYNGLVTGVTGQLRRPFGLSYRSNRELHLVYNATAAPSDTKYATLADSISITEFSWDFTTVPVDIPGSRPSAHLIIVVDDAQPSAISDLEALIYGDDDNDPVLPSPPEVLEIFESHTTLRITDNGDGSWTAIGPSSAIVMLDSTTFQITWPSAIFIDATSYKISSL
jgi:hypothetical protein